MAIPRVFATPNGQGLFIVNTCSSITNPINGNTWCFQINSNPPSLYEYVGSTYVLAAGGSFPPSADLSMGGFRLRSLAPDSSTGDALSKNQSVLSDLTGPGGTNFNMSNLTFINLAAATGNQQPIATGVINTGQGTQVSTNSIINILTKGALCNGTNDDTTAIVASINALPTISSIPYGVVQFPATNTACVIGTANTVLVPRGVILQGAPGKGTQIHFTPTSGAAVVYEDNIGGGLSNIVKGGLRDIYLTGSGSGHTAIGLYLGGDPAGVIAPNGAFGDSGFFSNIKIQNFGTGIQLGQNSFLWNIADSLIYSNGVGFSAPVGTNIGCENCTFHHDQFDSNITPLALNNQFSDWRFYDTSFDFNTNASTGNWMIGEMYGPHFETCWAGNGTGGPNSCSGGAVANVPAFIDASVGGTTGQPKLIIYGGTFSMDASSGTSAELFRINGVGTPNSEFILDGSTIFTNAGQTITQVIDFLDPGVNSVLHVVNIRDYLTSTSMPALTNALIPWAGELIFPANSQVPGADTIFSTTYGYRTIYSGSGASAVPAVCTFDQMICTSDAAACTNGTSYSAGGGSVRCQLYCGSSNNWLESGAGC